MDCGQVLSGIVLVDEIHDGSQYGDYIELLFVNDRIGPLQLSGSALSSSVTIPSQSWEANKRYLLVSTTLGLHHNTNVIVLSGLNVGTGLLSISSTTTPLTYALIDTSGQSVYRTQSFLCVDNFTTLGSPSPGFDQQFLSYLNTQTITQLIT